MTEVTGEDELLTKEEVMNIHKRKQVGSQGTAGSLGFSQNQVSVSFQNLCFPLLAFLLMLLALFFLVRTWLFVNSPVEANSARTLLQIAPRFQLSLVWLVVEGTRQACLKIKRRFLTRAWSLLLQLEWG